MRAATPNVVFKVTSSKILFSSRMGEHGSSFLLFHAHNKEELIL